MSRAPLAPRPALWPPSQRRSLALRALEVGLDTPAAPELAERIAEYEEFPQAVIIRFEATVKRGKAEDNELGFRRFASEDFSRFGAFLQAARDDGRLCIPRADLRADPGPWLEKLMAEARGPSPDSKGARQVLTRGRRWIEHQPVPEPEGFRYYEPALFDLLSRLRLTRGEVVQVFGQVLGRAPEESAILELQTHTTPETLRDLLMRTPEGRRRQPPARLGWPLAQVFVSRRSKVIYCPIGKVACTFLKQQMVRISDVEEPERVLKSVHVETDSNRTGLQLKDYPLAEVRELIAAPDMLRFAVLRDPADRLLSAYIEKFVMMRMMKGNFQHSASVLTPVQTAQGLDAPDFERGISFRDFITYIVTQPPCELDTHWRPQHLYLDGIDYDHIYSIEQLGEVVDMLEARSGVSLPRRPTNTTGSGIGADHPGAADLLPAEIEALGRLSRASFFDAALESAIAEYFRDDYQLLEQARRQSSDEGI